MHIKRPHEDSGNQKRIKASSTLVLTDGEKQLFDLFRRYLHETQRATVLRVSGGWVRDKLLGRECGDIDIAIDDTTGAKFATDFRSWILELKDCEIPVSTIGIIKSDITKSKHLETATMRVFGFSLDFVNLRVEVYEDESIRIPTKMEFGTPEDDATRRDFTMNSLFWNITEEKIEDFTGRGLSDLQQGILDTPVDPVTTLTDDPLRLVRGLRLHSQLGFNLSDRVLLAARNSAVQTALATRVSKPRMWLELHKMLAGEHYLSSLEICCCDLRLFQPIFHVADPYTHGGREILWVANGIACLKRLERFVVDEASDLVAPYKTRNSSQAIIVALSGLFFCLRNELAPPIPHRKGEHPLLLWVTLQVLQTPKDIADNSVALARAAWDYFLMSVNETPSGLDVLSPFETTRSVLWGMLKAKHGKVVCPLAPAFAVTFYDANKERMLACTREADEIAEDCPLPYNGKTILGALYHLKPGKEMGHVINWLRQWVYFRRNKYTQEEAYKDLRFQFPQYI